MVVLLSAVCCWSLCGCSDGPGWPCYQFWKAVTYPGKQSSPTPRPTSRPELEEGDIVGNATAVGALHTI